jgi:hypothetical protein
MADAGGTAATAPSREEAAAKVKLLSSEELAKAQQVLSKTLLPANTSTGKDLLRFSTWHNGATMTVDLASKLIVPQRLGNPPRRLERPFTKSNETLHGAACDANANAKTPRN